MGGIGTQVVDPLETLAHTDGPGNGSTLDLQNILDLVENDGAIVDVMRGGDPIAVISPAPVAVALADLRRALAETPADDSYYLDVMATRRMLGL